MHDLHILSLQYSNFIFIFQMSQPRSLEELLKHFNEISVDTVDSGIDSNIHSKGFKDFLSRRDMTTELHCLEFLILTQSLAKENNNNNSKTKKDSQKTEVIRLCQNYFCDDGERPIYLNNAELYEAILEMYERLKEQGAKLTAKDTELIMKARNDFNVWENGVEPQYMKFLSTTNRSAIACLLSIL